MKPLILLCLLALMLSACASTQPVRSSCFSDGKATCTFTPIQTLWADAP